MWTTWYVLPGQGYLLETDAVRVIAAIERLKVILMRPPTVDEIAVETGITPDGAEKLAYKLAAQTGWFNPKPELIRDSREKLGEVLVCAARMRDGKVGEDGESEDFNYDDDIGIIDEARRFLKEHVRLLPRLTGDGENVVSWPSEALKYLGEDYKPKERAKPHLWVVRI